MNALFTRSFALLSLVASAAFLATPAQADPLPGRDLLKFSQLPMISTPILDPNGVAVNYTGHDELSTAYGFQQPGQITTLYQGRYMADDFGDKLSTPVLHVKWWGSYLNNFIDPNMPVNKFLISFESDQPVNTANSFSHPDIPLVTQVVSKGALAPASGTFTEKIVPGSNSIDGPIYEYNAELNLGNSFPELADNVYWIKIAALVDLPLGFNPNFDPYNPGSNAASPPVTQWGWHNRDYTIKDTLASTLTGPGETQVGVIGNNVPPLPVYHFQDDAVAGDVRVVMGPAPATQLNPQIFQPVMSMSPQLYRGLTDGPATTAFPNNDITHFSKDLAFQLYTQVPEPSTCLLLISGCLGLALIRRRRAGC